MRFPGIGGKISLCFNHPIPGRRSPIFLMRLILALHLLRITMDTLVRDGRKEFCLPFFRDQVVSTMYRGDGSSWIQAADVPGGARQNAVGFSINDKGYIGTGSSEAGALKNDVWEYNPSTNSWTQKANFGGTARQNAVGLSIGSKGYIGTGNDGADKQDFWELDLY